MVVNDLNEGENSFRRLAENLPGIVYRVLLEDDNRVIFFNNMVQTMTGYRPEDLKKGNIYSLDPLILPEDKLNVINIVKDAIENNVPFEVEYRISNKSGDIKWFFDRSRPTRGDKGKPSYFDGIIFDITKRKETEQKLKESEAKYRLMAENANDLIVIINKNFEFEYINEPVHRRLRGTSGKDRIGKSVLSIIHPEDLEAAMKSLKDGFDTREGKTEVRLINKDGTYDWFEVRGKTFIDNDGNVKAILISRNIKERKLTEQALIKSEKKFRNIFESIPLGLHLYELNPQGNLIFKGCNPAANKILNTNCEQFISKTIEEAFPLLVKTDIPMHYKLLAKEGGIWKWDQVDYEENQIKGAFEVVAFQTAPNTMVTSFKDITERIELENAIRTSEEKYKSLFEQTPMAKILVNIEGKIEDCNTSMEDLSGYTKEELLGIDYLKVDIFPPGTKLILAKSFSKFLKTGVPEYSELQLSRKDGKLIWISSYPINIKIAEKSYILAVIQDITERKKLMEELRVKDIVFNVSLSAQSIADINGIINNVNPAFLKMWGYKSKEEAIGNSVSSFFANPNDSVPVLEALNETGKWEGEFFAKRCDGSTFITQGFASAIYNENGDKIGFQATNLNITKHKEAELKLKSETEKVKKYLGIAGVVILALDIKGNITVLNKKGYELLKYEEGELIGKNWFETCIPIHNRKEVSSVFESLMRNDLELVEFHENSILTKSGEEKIIAWKNTLIHDDNGKIIGTLSSGEDITERKKAVLKLKESEEKYRTLIEGLTQTGIGVDIIDLNHNIIYQNDFLKSRFGEHNGRKCYEHFLGRKNYCKNCPMEKAINTNRVEELNITTPDNRIYEVTSAPLPSKEGKVDRAAEVIIDVTERVQFEQKLKESEEKYRHLFENSPYYIILLDKEGNFIDCNNSTVDIYGFPKEDFSGKSFREMPIIPPDLLPLLENVMELLFKGENPPPIEFKPITKEGKKIWINSQASLIKLDHEFFIYIIGQDITERKKAEQKLKESEHALKVSEEKYRSFIENFQGIAYQGYDDYSTDFFQGAVEEITGYTPEDFITGRIKWNQLFHPDDVSKLLTRQKKFEESPLTQFEYRIKAKDGSTHWILSKTQKFYDETKKKVGGRGIFIDITDKKKSEQLLKESEKKYRHLFESSPFFIGLIDENGILVDCNSSISKFLSMRTKEDVIGKKIVDTLSIVEDNKEIIPLMKKLFQEANSNEQGKSYEFKLHRSIGGFLWLKVEGSTVEINNRKLLQFIAQDITKRKIIEEDLKESEIKFRTIAEQFLMGIGILQDEEVKYANMKLANMYGYSVEEFIGKTYSEFLNLIHPEDRAKLIRQVEKRKDRTRDTTAFYQFRAFKKTGELFWATIYSRIITYQGKRAGLLTILDNTEIKKAELKLKESEEKFRKIAEQSFMGIIIRQHDSIKYVNDAALNIYGFSMDKIQEWSQEYIAESWVHSEDLPYIRKNRSTERQHDSEIKHYISYRITTKSGKLRWIDQYSKIILYQGEISELITIVDITEKKEAERLIIEENKKLLELDKIRSDFLIRASHELKTPLNSIYSASEFLLHYNEEILNEKLKKFLEIIYKGGKRLKTLIESLLDVTRIESVRFELNMAERNIRKIIENCIKEVDYLSKRRNISIIFEKSEDILLVLDKIRMEQVFVNIIVNAIKNTPNYGEVIIKTLQEKDQVKITIIDTGVGFTEEEKGKIFKKFGKIERYGQGMDIDTEGSGLGLFISKEIVELHGGKIEFKSDGRNKGSTFLIKLPIHTLN